MDTCASLIFSFRESQGSPLAKHSSLLNTQKFDVDFQWGQTLWLDLENILKCQYDYFLF